VRGEGLTRPGKPERSGIQRIANGRQPSQVGIAAFSFFRELAVTPLDQLRLRLPDHDFARLMEAAKPLAVPNRDAFLNDVAADLGKHEVVGPGLLHRIISEVQRRYITAGAPTGAE